MTRFLSPCLIAALTAAMLGASAGAGLADCAGLINDFKAALERATRDLKQGSLEPVRGSIETLKTLEQQIGLDAACGNRLVDAQRGRTAVQLLLAQQLVAGGVKITDAPYEALISDADKPDVAWGAAYAQGNIRFAQRRYAEAAEAYGRALENIKNESKTSVSPGEKTIKTVFDRAVQARMLAANEENKTRRAVLVPTSKDHRDGTLGGVFSRSFRNVEIITLPMPIRFETDSAKLSPVGEAAANELLTAIKEQIGDASERTITIIGHTDERGGDAHNMRLSEARAQAVAKFLRDHGVKAKIIAIGRGKREPLEAVDKELAREEIWSLHRRVEWKRDKAE